MQYVLTQEELDALVSKDEVRKRDQFLDLAHDLILKHTGFECIHKKKGRSMTGYCDNCPLSDFAFPHELGRNQLCKLSKNYSK